MWLFGCMAMASSLVWIVTAAQTEPSPPPVLQFPPVSELPSQPEFSDPLVMSDGRRVTTPEQWFNERRPELIALFQHYMYGFLPPAPQETVGKIVREDRMAFNGRATIKEVTVTFAPPRTASHSLDAGCSQPPTRSGAGHSRHELLR